MKYLCFLVGIMLVLPAEASLEAMAAAAPVPNRVYLHADPRVGDFARYRSLDGSQLMHMEIVEANAEGENRRFVVRVHWPEASGLASGFLLGHAYDFQVDHSGRVLAATLEHLSSGRRLPLKPAGPGELGYIDTPQIESLDSEQVLRNGDVEFAVDSVLLYEINQQSFAGPSRMTSTNFLSSTVPFGLVRQINVVETEVTMVEVAKLINSYSSASDTVIGIVDWLLDQSVFQRTENGMQLVEYGYSERTAGQ